MAEELPTEPQQPKTDPAPESDGTAKKPADDLFAGLMKDSRPDISVRDPSIAAAMSRPISSEIPQIAADLKKRDAERLASIRKVLDDNKDRCRSVMDGLKAADLRIKPIATVPWYEQMRDAEVEREHREVERKRELKRAAKKVDDFVLWAFRDKSKRSNPFDGLAWSKSKEWNDLDAANDVITQAVLARHFNYVGERFTEEPDDDSVYEATGRMDGLRRSTLKKCDVVFTKDGLTYAKKLYRQKISVLRFLPTKFFSRTAAKIYVSLGWIVALLTNMDKLILYTKAVWNFGRSFFH